MKSLRLGAAAALCLSGSILAVMPTAAIGQAAASRNDFDVRRAMRDFVSLVYVDRNPAAAYDRYAAPILFDPTSGKSIDRSTAASAVEQFVRIPDSVFDIKDILIDGDLAVVRYYGAFDPKKPGADVAEFFRWKDGKVAEHWAILQMRQPVGRVSP